MKKKSNTLTFMLLVLLVGAGAFLGWMWNTSRGEDIEDSQGSSSSDITSSLTSSQPEESESSSSSDSSESTDPTSDQNWALMLVNKDHPLDADYTVDMLQLDEGYYVDARIYDAVQEMLAAVRAEGLSPLVCSAYRSYERQTVLYDNKVAEYLAMGYGEARAKEEAARWVTLPGTSEHQTGLALDIVSSSFQVLDNRQADTPEQKWLMAHCHEYGFILRYPSDKEDVTQITYEPWHYRYVGKEAAKEIMEQGLCLEEYLES